MRLLIVTRTTPFHRLGGMEIVTWDLARGLQQKGHEVTILTTQAPSLPEFTVKDGVAIHTVDAAPGRYSRRWWRLSAEAFRNNYAGKVDLVLGISAGAHAIFDECRVMSSPLPLVLQSHGTFWAEIVAKMSVRNPLIWASAVLKIPHLLREWRLGHYAQIIPIGPEVMNRLTRAPMRWLVGRTPLVVIENGIDEQQFRFNENARNEVRRKLGIPQDAIVVASVGRISAQKGSERALQAFISAAHTRNHLHYVIAGQGPAVPILQSMVSRAALDERVHFVGATERKRVPDILSAADMFLFCSRHLEGLAIAPLEAAANGLHCILSRHIVPPGLACSAVNPGDIDEIVGAIADAAGRKRSTVSILPARYSLHHATDCYDRLFTELIASRTQLPIPSY